jgi:hypothetical protein
MCTLLVINRSVSVQRYLALLLVGLLILAPNSAAGQQLPVPQPPPSTPPTKIEPMAPLPTVQNLKIFVLAGQGEMNDLERRVMAPVVVEVRDQNDQPIEGAEVIFRFPPTGPSASFTDQKPARTVRTNGQGQAAATGWIANNQVGSFTLNVTAGYGNQMGQAAIKMFNVTRITDDMVKDRKKKRAWYASRKWQILMAVGAGAAIAGIVLATGKDSAATTAPPTITITPGTVTIGGR